MMIYAVGFLAQAFFSARILCQWIMSERAKRVVSPSIFWILSLSGAYLLCFYGWLRHDFAIILGQVIAYYIYLWNLNEKGVWKRLPAVVRWAVGLTPAVLLALMLRDFQGFVNTFLRNEGIPLWLVIFGSAGQVIFTLRFVYQFAYSVRNHESVLPAGFWIISLVGSAIIIAYGAFRLDPVLILGQSVGFIAYSRNLMIGFRSRKVQANEIH